MKGKKQQTIDDIVNIVSSVIETEITGGFSTTFMAFDDFWGDEYYEKELFGQKEFSVGGLTVPKDKLISENRYIRFGAALDILNANNGLWAYKMGTQSVTCRVNNYGLIGAFPKFSTS